MTRGYSLEKDLTLLLNNPKYSDIEILCEDEKKLHGCRAILAARSEVFDRLLYNGMKESHEKQISFPKISSFAMGILLEYTYTGSIKEESLTKNNIVETFYAADYFQLSGLQDIIMKTFKNNHIENSPELLSKVAKIMPLNEDNVFLNLLIESVATIPLNTIEFDRLSITGLQYLLSYTHGKEKPFATPEYEVFRYSAILAAKQVSDDACKTLMEKLPALEQMEQIVQVENKFITDHQKVVKELEPFVKYIDFKLIEGQVLVDIIEPLEIIPIEIILNVYRYSIKSLNLYSNIRGIPMQTYRFNEADYVWDQSACGSNLIIEDNGKVVYAYTGYEHQNVRAKMTLEGSQPTGWVLGSGGDCYNSDSRIFDYCPSFTYGAKITVHLDMNKRTCAFTVNGIKYPEVSQWNNLPSKLYPVVSLCYPGCLRIQPHQKI
ncbi:hypothetical protein C1645_512896 [Glomus cerebriforme]|uniref:BTB domain-containing protein n=1 Tax=Glomus cerebriforme TaxID=658196 RepID=A0A397SC16_9GLOM|nr:hypothetical protein C1645_512896 [Glomus cerebriforme]